MPSKTPTRRQLLSASGGCLSAALAGCAGPYGSSSSSGVASDGSPVKPTFDYESLSIRSETDTPVAYPSEDAADDADGNRRSRYLDEIFVVNEDDAAALWFTDATAADDVDDARAFVEGTDFASESVVVDQRSIEDCYRRHLLSVRAADDEFRTSYCREMKAATEPCEADTTVVEAIFVRVHRPYDEPPSSRGSSETSTCPSVADVGNESTANGTDGDQTASETNGTDGDQTASETNGTDTAVTEGER